MIPVQKLLDLRLEYRERCQQIKDEKTYPFYSWCCDNVPGYKTMKGNIAFRLAILKRAANDLDFKNAVYTMCKKDILFYINTFCIAAGTKVVTDRGLVAIENVLSSDLVWDGDSWVSQKGVLHKGRKSVIMAYGIELTPNHKVRTNHGWKEAVQGYDREEIRLPDGYSEKWSVSQHDTRSMASSMCLREGMDSGREQLAAGLHSELRLQERGKENNPRIKQETYLCCMDEHEGEMPESKQRLLLPIRGERNTDRPPLDEVRELPKGYGNATEGLNTGKDRQRRELHQSELQMGDSHGAGKQHKAKCGNKNVSRLVVDTRGGSNSGCMLRDHAKAVGNGASRRSTSSAQIQQTAEVYDLLDCGPKHAFTVIGSDGRPLLVHNCMTYDPRLEIKTIPFITYDFQDVAIDTAVSAKGDLYAEKSRDMGASWIFLTIEEWEWQFHEDYSALLGSRTEDYVDKKGDRKSLMWKIDSIIENQPRWLQPNMYRIYLHFENLDNGSTIEGESTTGDFARGGRWTRIMLDEFAAVEPDGQKVAKATRDATRRRTFNSTHQGAATYFYRIGLTNIKKLIMHWSIHPEKEKGLYYWDREKIVRLDDWRGEVTVDGKTYEFPSEYPFIKDDKLRSPWYDNECARAEHPMEIAQELDIDPFSSDFQFFDPLMIQEIEEKYVCNPYDEGVIEFDEDNFEPISFEHGVNGPLKIWLNLDYNGKCPYDMEVACGIDISAGTGASNSTMSFVNLRTGEKIAEYANPWIKPEAFAHVAIAYCNFFNNAFMIPDASGPTGRVFCDEILRLGYRNLYYRRNEEGLTKKVSDKPGIFLNPKEKSALLGLYRRSLKDAAFIQRSHEANQECLEYIHKTGNDIEHSSAVNSIDPSGAGASHGDRTIADALAAKGVQFLAKKVTARSGIAPRRSHAARVRRRELKARKRKEW